MPIGFRMVSSPKTRLFFSTQMHHVWNISTAHLEVKKAEVVSPNGTFPHSAKGPWNKSFNFFSTKYVIPKSLKVSHWLNKIRSLQNVPELVRIYNLAPAPSGTEKHRDPPLGKTSPKTIWDQLQMPFFFGWSWVGLSLTWKAKKFTLTCCSPRCHIRAKVLEHKLQRSLPLPWQTWCIDACHSARQERWLGRPRVGCWDGSMKSMEAPTRRQTACPKA